MAETYPVIDRRRLADVSGGDVRFERELMEAFVEDARKRVSQMVQARDGGNAVDVRTAAHTLKGSARNVGALAIADLAALVETCAAADGLPDGELLERLRAGIDRLAKEMEVPAP